VARGQETRVRDDTVARGQKQRVRDDRVALCFLPSRCCVIHHSLFPPALFVSCPLATHPSLFVSVPVATMSSLTVCFRPSCHCVIPHSLFPTLSLYYVILHCLFPAHSPLCHPSLVVSCPVTTVSSLTACVLSSQHSMIPHCLFPA